MTTRPGSAVCFIAFIFDDVHQIPRRGGRGGEGVGRRADRSNADDRLPALGSSK